MFIVLSVSTIPPIGHILVVSVFIVPSMAVLIRRVLIIIMAVSSLLVLLALIALLAVADGHPTLYMPAMSVVSVILIPPRSPHVGVAAVLPVRALKESSAFQWAPIFRR